MEEGSAAERQRALLAHANYYSVHSLRAGEPDDRWKRGRVAPRRRGPTLPFSLMGVGVEPTVAQGQYWFLCDWATVGPPMKNITLSVDDDTYRLARIAAAERDTTVSALVRAYLRTFGRPGQDDADPAAVLFSVLDRAQGFRAADRMTRDDAHER